MSDNSTPPAPDSDAVADPPEGQAAAAEPAKGKAGRNLPVAIGVGVALGLVVLASLVTYKWLFAVIAVIGVGIGLSELIGAFREAGIRIARTPLYVGLVAMAPMAYLYGLIGQTMVFGLMVISALIWRIRRGTDGYVKDVTATVFAAAYLPFMMGFTMLMLAAPLGPQLIIVFVCLTISNDIGGYAAGVLFGKHPIAPQVSPKKSWEGLAGSAILQSAIGAWLFVWLLDAHWWQGVVAGLVMTVTATAGDFAESAIKRDLGVKDMGTILPGHGGVMDRLDSLVPNAFVAWLLFSIFGLVPMVT